MKKKIEPIVIEGLNCIENTMITVCNSLCGEYKRGFWNSWTVKYRRRYFSEGGFIIPKLRIETNLRKIYGLEFTPVGSTIRNNLIRKLKHQLDKNGLAIIGIKTNFCPWQQSYHEQEYSVHFLIVTKLLSEGVLCVDTMPKKQDEFISWKDIRSGVSELVEVERLSNGCKNVTIKNSKEKYNIHYLRANVCKNVKPQTLNGLIQDIHNKQEVLYSLAKERNIWRVTIYQQIFIMVGVHCQFEQFLAESKMSDGFGAFFTLFHNLIQEWEFLKLLIIRLHRDYWSSKLTSERLDETIESCKTTLLTIMEKEKESINLFCQLVDRCNYSGERVIDSTGYIFFKEKQLTLHYNEVSHMVKTEKFEISNCLPFGLIVKTKILSYKFPPKENSREAKNSLYCDGQRISIGAKLIKIGFIGYATYGNQSEYLTVVYENNFIKKYGIALSDWTEAPLLNEEIVWQAEFRNKMEDGYSYTGKIITFVVDLDKTKKCENIILPLQKEIHILGITIAIVEK